MTDKTQLNFNAMRVYTETRYKQSSAPQVVGSPMTLLLGALNTNAIVFGADGAEFHYAPKQPRDLAIPTRRKVLPIAGRAVAIGVHGMNRLASQGATLDSEEKIIWGKCSRPEPSLGASVTSLATVG